MANSESPYKLKETIMHQEAILLTTENASMIAERTAEYHSATDLLEDYGYMLIMHMPIVLALDVNEDFSTVSYVVTTGLFNAFAKTDLPLNDHTFQKVTQL
jgi:hypothetical protein